MDGTKHRAKVYQLNDDGQWDDRGTGYAAVQYIPAQSTAFVVVVSEHDQQLLLESRVYQDDIYQRQGDTIISWTEPETNMDMALSFQESPSCQEVWEQLCLLQGRSPDGNDEAKMQAPEESAQAQEEDTVMQSAVELPACELRNLPQLSELFNEGATVIQKKQLAQALLAQDYLKSLLQLFNMCEDLENLEGLVFLFKIWKGIILLNDSAIYDIVFKGDFLLEVMGALEYDPDIAHAKPRHRHYLQNVAKFKQAIPIQNEELLSKIHQNFRLQYLKDVVLPRHLDDHTFASLNSITFFNNVHIVSHLQNDSPWLSQLFEAFKKEGLQPERRKDLLSLLLELLTMAKNLQLFNRTAFYRVLNEHGLFSPLASCLEDEQRETRLVACEVLTCCINHDSSMVRVFILSESPSFTLFNTIVKHMCGDADNGIKGQLVETCKVLLDMETMEGREQDDFLNLIYEDTIHHIISPLSSDELDGISQLETSGEQTNGEVDNGEKVDKEAMVMQATRCAASAEDWNDEFCTKNHTCELLSFCIQYHGYRIKYFILRNNVLSKVLRLCKYGDKCLMLAAVRVFRSCIALKDEFYNRYIIKNQAFEPMVHMLLKYGNRNTLLNSAVVELFELIRKENIKSLIQHLAQTYGSTLVKLDYVETFPGIVLRYEQNTEKAGLTEPNPETTEGGGKDKEKGRRDFSYDDDDDAYFNGDSDDESNNLPPPPDTVDDSGFKSYKAHLEDKENRAAAEAAALGGGLRALAEYGNEDGEEEDTSGAGKKVDTAKRRRTDEEPDGR